MKTFHHQATKTRRRVFTTKTQRHKEDQAWCLRAFVVKGSSWCLGVLVANSLLLSSCASNAEVARYEAEYSAWKLALTWTHRFPERRFESLELIVDPSKRDMDLPIDGQVVIADYQHGGDPRCPRAHSVDGTLRLVELGGSQVRARLDARLKCPGGETVPLKGDFTFDVKTPP